MTRCTALAAMALASISGCGWLGDGDSPSSDNRRRQLYVEVVEVDGREIPCVVYDSNSDAGAVDCDWGAE